MPESNITMESTSNQSENITIRDPISWLFSSRESKDRKYCDEYGLDAFLAKKSESAISVVSNDYDPDDRAKLWRNRSLWRPIHTKRGFWKFTILGLSDDGWPQWSPNYIAMKTSIAEAVALGASHRDSESTTPDGTPIQSYTFRIQIQDIGELRIVAIEPPSSLPLTKDEKYLEPCEMMWFPDEGIAVSHRDLLFVCGKVVKLLCLDTDISCFDVAAAAPLSPTPAFQSTEGYDDPESGIWYQHACVEAGSCLILPGQEIQHKKYDIANQAHQLVSDPIISQVIQNLKAQLQ